MASKSGKENEYDSDDAVSLGPDEMMILDEEDYAYLNIVGRGDRDEDEKTKSKVSTNIDRPSQDSKKNQEDDATPAKKVESKVPVKTDHDHSQEAKESKKPEESKTKAQSQVELQNQNPKEVSQQCKERSESETRQPKVAQSTAPSGNEESKKNTIAQSSSVQKKQEPKTSAQSSTVQKKQEPPKAGSQNSTVQKKQEPSKTSAVSSTVQRKQELPKMSAQSSSVQKKQEPPKSESKSSSKPATVQSSSTHKKIELSKSESKSSGIQNSAGQKKSLVVKRDSKPAVSQNTATPKQQGPGKPEPKSENAQGSASQKKQDPPKSVVKTNVQGITSQKKQVLPNSEGKTIASQKNQEPVKKTSSQSNIREGKQMPLKTENKPVSGDRKINQAKTVTEERKTIQGKPDPARSGSIGKTSVQGRVTPEVQKPSANGKSSVNTQDSGYQRKQTVSENADKGKNPVAVKARSEKNVETVAESASAKKDENKNVSVANKPSETQTPTLQKISAESASSSGNTIADSNFRGVVLIANSSYKDKLEKLVNDKVKLVLVEDATLTSMLEMIRKNSVILGNNILWILIAGIFSVTDETIHNICDYSRTTDKTKNPISCKSRPLYRLTLQKEFEGRDVKEFLDARMEIIETFFESIQTELGDNGIIATVPPMPAAVVSTRNRTHSDLHELISSYGYVATNSEREKIHKSYPYFCELWTTKSVKLVESWIDVSDLEIFQKKTYWSSLGSFSLVDEWVDSLGSFIELVMTKPFPRNDGPPMFEQVVVLGHTKYNTLLQSLTQDLPVTFIEESIDLNEDGLEVIRYLTKKVSSRSLWCVMAGVSEISTLVLEGSFKCRNTKCTEPFPVFVTKNHYLGETEFAGKSDEEMTDAVVRSSFDFAASASKVIGNESALFMTPIIPQLGFFAGFSAWESHKTLHKMYDEYSQYPFVIGTERKWLECTRTFENKWLKRISESFPEESIPRRLLETYTHEKESIFVFGNSKKDLDSYPSRQKWSKVMLEMIRYFLKQRIKSHGTESSPLKTPSQPVQDVTAVKNVVKGNLIQVSTGPMVKQPPQERPSVPPPQQETVVPSSASHMPVITSQQIPSIHSAAPMMPVMAPSQQTCPMPVMAPPHYTSGMPPVAPSPMPVMAPIQQAPSVPVHSTPMPVMAPEQNSYVSPMPVMAPHQQNQHPAPVMFPPQYNPSGPHPGSVLSGTGQHQPGVPQQSVIPQPVPSPVDVNLPPVSAPPAVAPVTYAQWTPVEIAAPPHLTTSSVTKPTPTPSPEKAKLVSSQGNSKKCHVMIQNIKTEMNKADVSNLLKPFGTVENLEWLNNKDGVPGGFMMVTFADDVDAEAAVRVLNFLKVFGDESEVKLFGNRSTDSKLESKDMNLLMSIHGILDDIQKDIKRRNTKVPSEQQQAKAPVQKSQMNIPEPKENVLAVTSAESKTPLRFNISDVPLPKSTYKPSLPFKLEDVPLPKAESEKSAGAYQVDVIYEGDLIPTESLNNLFKDLGALKCGENEEGKLCYTFMKYIPELKLLQDIRFPDKRVKVLVSGPSTDVVFLKNELSSASQRLTTLLSNLLDPIGEQLKESIGKEINYYTFKVKLCRFGNSCSNKDLCHDYHGFQDKRRDPFFCKYSSQLCLTRSAHNKNSCLDAHNEFEKMLHSNNYKVAVCPSSRQNLPCVENQNGKRCYDVHKGEPDMFYHENWQNLYVEGLMKSLDFLCGAIKNLFKFPDLKCPRILFITASYRIARFYKEVISDLLSACGQKCVLLQRSNRNNENAAVIITTVSTIIPFLPLPVNKVLDKKVDLNRLKALIIDDGPSVFSSLGNKQDSLHRFGTNSYSDLNIVVTAEEVNTACTEQAKEFLDLKSNFKMISTNTSLEDISEEEENASEEELTRPASSSDDNISSSGKVESSSSRRSPVTHAFSPTRGSPIAHHRSLSPSRRMSRRSPVPRHSPSPHRRGVNRNSESCSPSSPPRRGMKRSPDTRHSPLPPRRATRRSPDTHRSLSPFRRAVRRSPDIRRSPSPSRRTARRDQDTRRSPSPYRRAVRSPDSHHSLSPSRRAFRRSRSSSPLKRKLRSRSPSPKMPHRSSPVPRRSPSPLRRTLRRSPVTRRSPSPLRKFPRRSPHTSLSPAPYGKGSRERDLYSAGNETERRYRLRSPPLSDKGKIDKVSPSMGLYGAGKSWIDNKSSRREENRLMDDDSLDRKRKLQEGNSSDEARWKVVKKHSNERRADDTWKREQEILKEKEELRNEYERELELYISTPEFHPSYEEKYGFFIEQYKKDFPGKNDLAHTEKLWGIFWKIKIQDLLKDDYLQRFEEIETKLLGLKQNKSPEDIRESSWENPSPGNSRASEVRHEMENLPWMTKRNVSLFGGNSSEKDRELMMRNPSPGEGFLNKLRKEDQMISSEGIWSHGKSLSAKEDLSKDLGFCGEVGEELDLQDLMKSNAPRKRSWSSDSSSRGSNFSREVAIESRVTQDSSHSLHTESKNTPLPTHMKGQDIHVTEILDLLSDVGPALGMLTPVLQMIVKRLRSCGSNESELCEVLRDKDNEMAIKMVADGFKRISLRAGSGDQKFKEAHLQTLKLLEYPESVLQAQLCKDSNMAKGYSKSGNHTPSGDAPMKPKEPPASLSRNEQTSQESRSMSDHYQRSVIKHGDSSKSDNQGNYTSVSSESENPEESVLPDLTCLNEGLGLLEDLVPYFDSLGSAALYFLQKLRNCLSSTNEVCKLLQDGNNALLLKQIASKSETLGNSTNDPVSAQKFHVASLLAIRLIDLPNTIPMKHSEKKETPTAGFSEKRGTPTLGHSEKKGTPTAGFSNPSPSLESTEYAKAASMLHGWKGKASQPGSNSTPQSVSSKFSESSPYKQSPNSSTAGPSLSSPFQTHSLIKDAHNSPQVSAGPEDDNDLSDSSFSLLEEVCPHLGLLSPVALVLVQSIRSDWPNRERVMELILDDNNSTLLKLMSENSRKLCDKNTSATDRRKYQMASMIISKLLAMREQASSKKKYLGLDLDKIARATYNKGTNFTIQYIRSALFLEGITDASNEDITNICKAVSTHHFGLAVHEQKDTSS